MPQLQEFAFASCTTWCDQKPGETACSIDFCSSHSSHESEYNMCVVVERRRRAWCSIRKRIRAREQKHQNKTLRTELINYTRGEGDKSSRDKCPIKINYIGHDDVAAAAAGIHSPSRSPSPALSALLEFLIQEGSRHELSAVFVVCWESLSFASLESILKFGLAWVNMGTTLGYLILNFIC